VALAEIVIGAYPARSDLIALVAGAIALQLVSRAQ
jgi:hypothetical protein